MRVWSGWTINTYKCRRSASYSKSGIMFLAKVVLGKAHNVTAFAQVKSCPVGKQSVSFLCASCAIMVWLSVVFRLCLTGWTANWTRQWSIQTTRSDPCLWSCLASTDADDFRKWLTTHSGCNISLAFSPDGLCLVSACWKFVPWDPGSGINLDTFTGCVIASSLNLSQPSLPRFDCGLSPNSWLCNLRCRGRVDFFFTSETETLLASYLSHRLER